MKNFWSGKKSLVFLRLKAKTLARLSFSIFDFVGVRLPPFEFFLQREGERKNSK
jgi:hypothetical protein